MSIFSIAIQSPNVGGGGACVFETIAGATQGFRILELGYTANQNQTQTVALGTPQAKGVTPTTPKTVLNEDGGDNTTGVTTVAVAWATAPTIPKFPIKRINTPAFIGAGSIFTFPPYGEAVAPNSSFVIWNYGSSQQADIWIVVEE